MKTPRQKIDARTRMQLDGLSGTVGVTVRTECEPSEGDLAELAAKGLKLHGRTGSILTGDVDAGRLLDVASLPFVRAVEGGRVMYGEKKP